MRMKTLNIKTLSLFVVILSISCNKEPQPIKSNKLEPTNYGGQKYLTESPIKEETKSEEQWRNEAQQYLEMKEGDTITVYNNENQHYIKQDNTEEENYEPFVDVKKIRETENLKQQRRKIIKERYYIENPNHTWRRVSRKEYYGQ